MTCDGVVFVGERAGEGVMTPNQVRKLMDLSEIEQDTVHSPASDNWLEMRRRLSNAPNRLFGTYINEDGDAV